MKQIEYDTNLALEIYNEFYPHCAMKEAVYGYIAEALVEKHYGKSINNKWTGVPDKGWDYIDDNGNKIDVKNTRSLVQFMGHESHHWIINCYHGLNADAYLCTELDTGNKVISLIGWITPDRVQLVGTFYKKDQIFPWGKRCNGDCYVVKKADITEILPEITI